MNNEETYKITKISEIYELDDEMQQLVKDTAMFNRERIKAAIATAVGLVTTTGIAIFAERSYIFLIFGAVIAGVTFASVATSIDKMRVLYNKSIENLKEKNGVNEVVNRMKKMGQDAYRETLIDDLEDEKENNLGGLSR